jgi:exo-1,4-beta-D-glucosaminidase
MRTRLIVAIGVVLVLAEAGSLVGQEQGEKLPGRMPLTEGWRLISSALVEESGQQISTGRFKPESWYPTTVPSTVLNALTRQGVYPDLRSGLNCFRIPDASEAFNARYDLARYSYLPDKRNPWLDPYWYRTEFRLPEAARGKQVWLNFDGIHYRADVWLNGQPVANAHEIVGSFSRYRLNVTNQVRYDEKNCLAVRIHQMDHPGIPDAQLDILGKDRQYRKDSMKDVGLAMFIGYDCMPPVPDRNMGLWQEVYLEFTGPVDIRDPFVATRLPLPKTSPADLTVTAELVNTTASRQTGLLVGTLQETGGKFQQPVVLEPGETKHVTFLPEQHAALRVREPRLWWPRNYGPQNLYHLTLRFHGGAQAASEKRATFGIRQVTKELYELDGAHGLRLHVNGQKIFCRGGYIQPEILFDWDAKRMEAELRYLAEANLNLLYFEDIPNPPDEFLDLCDRLGLMFGNCFYGCYWMTPGSGYPVDLELLARGTVDIIKRYRNHPSLVLYMAMDEGETREDVYLRWRKEILAHDGTRLFIPSGSFPDYRKDVPAWIKPDTPVGMNDYPPKSYGLVEPSQFYRWVRENRNWMFMMESGSASLPPIDSLRRFLPDLETALPSSARYPLTDAWAHHGANAYYKPYDDTLRRIFGQPRSVADYCWKGHLLTADQHRAMYEAANHRMWDVTSGFSEWKVNACWPSVQWQIYDWYLKPMVSYYYIKKACEPLHVQLTPIDSTVIVVNHHLVPKGGLNVTAKVFDFAMKKRWENTAQVEMPANVYREIFRVPTLSDLGPVCFVKLELKDAHDKLVSDNFYWLTPNGSADLSRLEDLPPVRLNAAWEVERKGTECVAHVKLTNPTDRLAFLVHLAVTRGPYGDEVLPVLWDDNYFSLLPGESRQLTARFATDDLGTATPALEVGGWNIESPFECTHLRVSKERVRADEPFTVTAMIANTSIDGSRIPLAVDGKVVDTQLFWARACARMSREIVFTTRLVEQGGHRVSVGGKVVSVTVE